MGSKRAEGKVWRGNRGLCPSFRRESLKTHQMFLLQLELYANILSHAETASPQLPCHKWGPALPQQVMCHSRRQGSAASLLPPAASHPTHQFALCQLEPFQTPEEPLTSDPQVLLACLLALSTCTICTGQCQERLGLGKAETDHSSSL